jgi:hypothetical protein
MQAHFQIAIFFFTFLIDLIEMIDKIHFQDALLIQELQLV